MQKFLQIMKRGYRMSSKTDTGRKSILAPLSGQAVPLEQVPDDVFSQKILGDGIAIIPTDGKLYAPVNGEIASVAETLHAYGFTSEDGLEILVARISKPEVNTFRPFLRLHPGEAEAYPLSSRTLLPQW